MSSLEKDHKQILRNSLMYKHLWVIFKLFLMRLIIWKPIDMKALKMILLLIWLMNGVQCCNRPARIRINYWGNQHQSTNKEVSLRCNHSTVCQTQLVLWLDLPHVPVYNRPLVITFLSKEKDKEKNLKFSQF